MPRAADLAGAASEAELRRLNWALAAYARSTAALIHADTLDDTVRGICNAIVANDVYALAWVGLVEHAPDKAIRIVSGAGPAINYLNGLDLSWSDQTLGGLGPTGLAVRDGTPRMMRDSLLDPVFAPWRAHAAPFGLRSSVTVPFRGAGEVLGVLAIYAVRPNAFGPDELSLFEKLGEELAFALSIDEDRARLKASEEARRAAEDARRETQAELARVGRLLTIGEFASSIAHEINQPIAAIVTNSDASLRWLGKATPDLDEARAAIQRIIRDANRASEIIMRTRAWLTKDASAHVPLDINAALDEILLYAESELRRARVTVKTDLACPSPIVVGDRIQLQQVMLNLILNGIDAMKSNTGRPRALTITSRGADGGDEVLVGVGDTGVGLDPANTERLFEHFFTTKAGGIGLGLPISRSIIEAHGGRLWASPAPGGGALFQFSLPTAGAEDPGG
jgi:signal transduction histidine kinase